MYKGCMVHMLSLLKYVVAEKDVSLYKQDVALFHV